MSSTAPSAVGATELAGSGTPLPNSTYSSLHAWAEMSYNLGHRMPRNLVLAGWYRRQALARVVSGRRR